MPLQQLAETSRRSLHQSANINLLAPFQRLHRYFAGAILALVWLHVLVFAVAAITGFERPAITRLFNLDDENNPGTWFSSLQLAACSALLALHSMVRRSEGDPDSRYWKWLAILFAFMSLDETSSLHEMLVQPSRYLFAATGFFYWAWVIPAMFFVAGFLVFYWRFLLRLPVSTLNGLLIAGTVYVAGAIGAEMIGGKLVDSGLVQSSWYILSTAIEEGLEMLGAWLLLRTMLAEFRELKASAVPRTQVREFSLVKSSFPAAWPRP